LLLLSLPPAWKKNKKSRRKLILVAKKQNKNFSEETAQRHNLETKGEYCQNSNGATRARPLKKLIRPERVKEIALLHVWH
jgi:hypothetical protein